MHILIHTHGGGGGQQSNGSFLPLNTCIPQSSFTWNMLISEIQFYFFKTAYVKLKRILQV